MSAVLRGARASANRLRFGPATDVTHRTASAHGKPFVDLRAPARTLAGALTAFLRDTSGGAMLYAGIALIVGVSGVGGGLANLAWQESRQEELLAAARAALTTAGPARLAKACDPEASGLSAADVARCRTALDAIGAHVEQFVEGLAAADVSNVDVRYDGGSRNIGVNYDASFDADLWPTNLVSRLGGETQEDVAVRFGSTRHEFAVALDVSTSMRIRFPNTNPVPLTDTRMKALKDAMGLVADNLQEAQRDSPAGMMVSIVPFSTAVRIADVSGATQTAQKKRYLNMMGGRTKAKWVDMFHHYGVGGTTEIALPAGWAWDKNVFSGCFMARWGAYWDALARPTPLAWPAKDVDNVPLHLSDAPPIPNASNTLFYPYSWPDAAPAGTIDARLQFAMGVALAGVPVRLGGVPSAAPSWAHDNNWSKTPGGGDMGCPEYPMMPLTDDVTAMRTYVNALGTETAPIGGGGTYTHLGVVWGLRALAADWQTTWEVKDSKNDKRPLYLDPDDPGDIKKSLIIISDGENHPGPIATGSLGYTTATHNPWIRGTPGCPGHFWSNFGQWYNNSGYLTAAAKTDDTTFNAQFGAGSTWRVRLATALGVRWMFPSTTKPSDVFRAKTAAVGDLLVANGEPRPTLVGRNLCHYTSMFSPYGRVGDAVLVDGTPRFGHAPFDGGQALPNPYDGQEKHTLGTRARTLLDGWMLEACQLAATRGVKVHAVYISETSAANASHIANLQNCTAASGGQMILTPDPAILTSTLSRLVRLERTLEFVDDEDGD